MLRNLYMQNLQFFLFSILQMMPEKTGKKWTCIRNFVFMTIHKVFLVTTFLQIERNSPLHCIKNIRWSCSFHANSVYLQKTPRSWKKKVLSQSFLIDALELKILFFFSCLPPKGKWVTLTFFFSHLVRGDDRHGWSSTDVSTVT